MGLEEAGLSTDVDEEGLDQFPANYYRAGSAAVGLDKAYVLGLVKVGDRLVAGLDSNSPSVHNCDTLVKLNSLGGHTAGVTGVASCPASANLAVSSSRDQTVKVWDLREGDRCVHTLKDTSNKKQHSGPPLDPSRPLTCVAMQGDAVVAGTEQVGVDSFLLFWDLRKPNKLQGGYWDSHSDDITTLAFNSEAKDSLASGSTDGLVNVFDLSQPDEDSALVTSHNTEDSVAGLVWYSRKGEHRQLAITTHTESVQLWDTEDFSPHTVFSRENVSHGMRRTVSEHCYISGLHPRPGEDGLVVVAGSRCPKNPTLRLGVIRNKKVKPHAELGTDCGVVRCSVTIGDSVVTGGEDGLIRLWKEGEEQREGGGGKLVNKTNVRDKPY
jgi:WD40 repeat protein